MSLPSYQNTISQEWQLDINGDGSSVVEGVDSLTQSVYMLLSTPRYSIPFMPNYGVLAMEYIGQDHLTIALIINDIQTQISTHIPEIETLDINWRYENAQLIIELRWSSTLGNGQNTIRYGTT